MAAHPIHATRNLGVAPNSNSERDAAAFAESSTRIKQSSPDTHTDEAAIQASLLAAFDELTAPELAQRGPAQTATRPGVASHEPRRPRPLPAVSRLPPGMPPLPVSLPPAQVSARKLTPPPLPVVQQDASKLVASQPRPLADAPPLSRQAPPLSRQAPPFPRAAPPFPRAR